MSRPTRLRHFDILDAIHSIELFLLNKTSEATRHVPDEMRARAPDIPWVSIEMFGNKTRHEYQTLSPRRVWRVAVEDLAPLKAAAQTFYAEAKRPGDPWPDALPK